jgi:nucleoside 2-deoxyribosyltransferase
MNLADSPKCFVISPIGSELAPVGTPERLAFEQSVEIWEKVILAACELHGLSPLRADMISRSGDIPEQVYRLLLDADLVIADITGANPNVMYELGFRHAVGKPAIQIGEYSRIPFDIANVRTVQFSRTPSGLVDARKRLSAAIETFLRGESDAVTASRIALTAQLPPLPAAATHLAQEPEESAGLLDQLAEMESALPTLAQIIQRAVEVQTELQQIATSAVQQMAESDAKGGGFGGRLAITRKVATQLENAATQMEEAADNYEQAMSRVGPGMDHIISQLRADPVQREQAAGFVAAIKGAAAPVEVAIVNSTHFAEVIRGLGRFAKPLGGPGRRIGDAVERIVKQMTSVQRWAKDVDS